MTMQDIPQELLLDFIQSRTSCRAFTPVPFQKKICAGFWTAPLPRPAGRGCRPGSLLR